MQSTPTKRTAADTWHIHRGTVALYIIGPGPTAMHRASESYYTGRIGTEDEWRIARRAVRILSHTAQDDAGPAEIHAALEIATHEISIGVAQITDESEPYPQPKNPPPAIATEEDARRVLAAVELVTGISVADFLRPSLRSLTESIKAPRARARAHACIAILTLYPDTPCPLADDALGFNRDSTNRARTRHREAYLKEPAYAKNHAAILEKLTPA